MTESISLISQINLCLNKYLSSFSKDIVDIVINEINTFSIQKVVFSKTSDILDYSDLDNIFSKINEKQDIRKKKGVYYTEEDITDFIVKKCVSIAKKDLFLFGTVFDPTCGSGEFLLTALRIKDSGNEDILEKLETLYGNDLNKESIYITKLRLLLYVFNKYGIEKINSIGFILNQNFTCEDFLKYKTSKTFDFIIGNPPYVEDKEISKYGNIYADILDGVASLSSNNGVIGFIIPLSYVATPRMKNIRELINTVFNTQYIYNFADRPGCLFTQVHQKLTIIIAKKSQKKKTETSNYNYWYKKDRKNLFLSLSTTSNKNYFSDFIPKIGSAQDSSVFTKIMSQKKELGSLILDPKKHNTTNSPKLFLNMRACFWIKAFLDEHNGNEYKCFYCETSDIRNFFYCLLNSSIFWWFWICISDCWHITLKEFFYFKIPESFDNNKVSSLATALACKLEETKKYIGSKQTDYEYKHKYCIKEIHAIDDYINSLFNLTVEENDYIKNFALKYRTSGGNQN